MAIADVIEKFNKFDVDYMNAQNYTREMRAKANEAPTPENLDAVLAAVEAQAARCREFRDWCTQKRDAIVREMLNDPNEEYSEDQRAMWRDVHKEIIERLPGLEADCPR